MNITISIDEDVVKEVRRVARERDTTLTAMVRESVANSDAAVRKARADTLETLERSSRDIGPHTWTRDDLYEEHLGRYGRLGGSFQNQRTAPAAE